MGPRVWDCEFNVKEFASGCRQGLRSAVCLCMCVSDCVCDCVFCGCLFVAVRL